MMAMIELDKNTLNQLLETMLKIRHFELAVEKNFMMGNIYGTAHQAIGQEGVAAGAISALRKDDFITSTHRGHHHCIAKGADVNRMMAELFGRATGYCKGKGGSMHIADVSAGNLGANGIVGGSAGIAIGAAFAAKRLSTGQIVICFSGDGSVNQGIWHESVNMASIWSLPVIFLIENNQYGMGTNVKKVTKVKKLSDRASAYDIQGLTIDGNNVLEVYNAVSELAKKLRAGKGPVLLEAVTYRVRGHSLRDAQRYRPKGEGRLWLEDYCPIKRFKKYLIDKKLLDANEIEKLEKAVCEQIQKAVEYANASPLPDIEKVMDDVYA